MEQIWRVRAVKRRWIHRGLLRERQVQTCEGFRGAAGNPKEAEQDTVV